MKKWSVKMTVKSPISHNDEVSLSTTTPFRRIRMVHENKVMDVPVYTGNAWRGLLRRAAAKDFVEKLELQNLTPDLYHILFAGGFLAKGAAGDIDVGFKKAIRKYIPYLSVFGGATGNTIIEGRLSVGILMPVAKETAVYTGIESDHSVYEYLDVIFYTHRDDFEESDIANDTVQMKYETEVLIPGTVLVSQLILDSDNEVELGALGAALEAWLGTSILGGRNAVGHGKVEAEFIPKIPNPKSYHEYLQRNKEEIIDFLKEAFRYEVE